jgi:NADH:ubiquinone oxidoreductase subunit 3 (subunit A)
LSQVVEHLLARQALSSNPTPTQKNKIKTEKRFWYFIWICQIMLFGSLSLLLSINLLFHSFTPYYTTIHQHIYHHLILSRSSDDWILILKWSLCSTLRYQNLLIHVVVIEINTIFLLLWHHSFKEQLLS